MTGLTLRAMTKSDVTHLADLGHRAFTVKFGHLYQPHDLESFLSTVFSPAGVSSDFADPLQLYRLAEMDGALVGFCKLGLRCGWPEHARGRNVIELKQLYLDPARTGGGIGAALMDWAIAQAKACGADEIQLSVFSENDGAQRFYARHGFDHVADTEFWVGNHRDHEFLFAKLL